MPPHQHRAVIFKLSCCLLHVTELQLGYPKTAKMNPNAWSKSLYCSNNFCLNGCTADQLSSFHLSPMPPAVSVPDIFFSRSEASSSLVHFPLKRLQALSSSCHSDLTVCSGRQAKRARVENIIKSMSGSPGANFSEAMANPQEDKSKTITLYQDQMEMLAMHQLQSQYQLCEQLEVKKEATNSKTVEKSLWAASPAMSRNSLTELYEVQPINYSQCKAGKVKLMADVLKCELSRAVSTSVDTIFKTQAKQDDNKPPLNPLMEQSFCKEHSFSHSYCETTPVQVPGFQTEALSLVVQKDKSDILSRHRSKHELKSHQKSVKCLKERGFEMGQTKMIDRSWYTLKARPKVNSRADRSLHGHTANHTVLESLQLDHAKSPAESNSLKNMYMVNEGLTTNHLKKAKLMFFYTRYPSSLVLKMCFSDVQFTRCITSQLIKWFSNFREFFYIQVEKFARHAVVEGVTDERDLTVGRESELFRVLNLHYNKTSDFQEIKVKKRELAKSKPAQATPDFQVPDRFFEVAEITLREFYVAICLGKDRDPSWKKAIYRVICKLDSDVPAHFITQSN